MKRYHRFSQLLKKKQILEITPVDEIQFLPIDSPNNIQFDPVNEISIIGKHLPENIKEPIDEIQIIGKELITNIYEPIDEIAIIGKERINNIFEPIDEIMIVGKDLDKEKISIKEKNNICMPAFELQICSAGKNIKKENKKDKALMALIDNNDSSIEERDRSDKENIDDNIDLNINESDNNKIKEINKLKSQLENEKAKIKELVKKIIELESEMNENKI